MDSSQIHKWVTEGLINEIQANKMLSDIKTSKKDKSSDRLITTISTFGAILLGIGAIMVVASNWGGMPDLVKVLIFMLSTFSSAFIGYQFKYVKKNFPGVGASLLFLGTLLFGATIFLISQIYNIVANSHVLVLIWIIGVIPLVYALRSVSIASLVSILYFIWIGLFIYRGASFGRASNNIIVFILMFLVSGLLLFGIGALHYASDKLKGIARAYRIIGLKAAMISLFILTFKAISGKVNRYYSLQEYMDLKSQAAIGLLIFAIIAVIIFVVNLLFNISKKETNIIESVSSLVVLGLSLIFLYFPSESGFYTIIFNIIFVIIIAILIYVGYTYEDMTLVNMGLVWGGVFVLVKYFDFLWELMPRSIFFLVGGIILVLGSIALEKKRRQIKDKFGTK